MSKEQLLIKHRKNVQNLRECAKNLNLNDAEIDIIFASCYKILQKHVERANSNKSVLRCRARKYFVNAWKVSSIFSIIIVTIYIILNVHQPTTSVVLRNVQGLIYPGLKIIRYLSVPIIERYPWLTELYDETCLLENPYFYVADMECWPCENVNAVIDLTGFQNHSLNESGVPYVIKTDQKEVTFENLQEMYLNNSSMFDVDASTVKSNNFRLFKINDIVNFTFDAAASDTHISWRVNRMAPSRIIRTLFPRPHIISEWSGQSIERFVLIDGPTAGAYALPNTECSYVFVLQGSGERTIVLKPSRECGDKCRTVSVILRASYVLWYNWWYWRPISLPARNGTKTSVVYVNSYC